MGEPSLSRKAGRGLARLLAGLLGSKGMRKAKESAEALKEEFEAGKRESEGEKKESPREIGYRDLGPVNPSRPSKEDPPPSS
jgi:hypothetical protein